MAWPILDWQFFLRQALFLGPLFATALQFSRKQLARRAKIGAFFSFLYAFPIVFGMHVLAVAFGLWTYDGDTLEVLGVPADIWFGGALLWGPVLYLTLPRVGPIFLVGYAIGLNALLLPYLSPLVRVGPNWFWGVVLVFLTAHLPALYLARWTERDVLLPCRAFLLAIAYGVLAFFLIPTLVMHAMGGDWSALTELSPLTALAAATIFLLTCSIGLTGVQMFALHGDGTPIPLDPTRHLVQTGIYAYVRNPMQLCTALAWLLLGVLLRNVWVALAAGMAVLFVLGMVRWCNRLDLGARFPEGWHRYSAQVPEWFPRWRPWIAEEASVSVSTNSAVARWLRRASLPGLVFAPGRHLAYREPNETREFLAAAAIAKLLNHTNLLGALVGALMLLVIQPAEWVLTRTWRRGKQGTGPSTIVFGIDHLIQIKRDQLAFYESLRRRYGYTARYQIGFRRVWLLTHPEQIHAALGSEASAFVRYERVMRVLSQWNGRSLLIEEGEHWRRRRQRVMPAFATRRLPKYCEQMGLIAEGLVARWRADAKDGLINVDTDREMVGLSLEIAAVSLFGQRLKAFADAAVLGDAVATLSDVAFEEATAVLGRADEPRKRAAIRTVRSIVETIVAHRHSSGDMDRGDVLSALVEACDDNPEALADEVTTLLIAGHETTSASLTWMFYLLGQHPNVRARVQDDLRALEWGAPLQQQLAAMPLLNAVISETLRLYPPAYTLFIRRAVRDVDLGGVRVRKNDLVQISPYVTQRDGAWFEKPETFLPERFLGEPGWPKFAYIPFGLGPRVCPGAAFATTEIAIVAAILLRDFTPAAVVQQPVIEPKFSLRPAGGLVQKWRLNA